MPGVWKQHWIRLLGQGGERRQHWRFLLNGINHAIGFTEGVAKSLQRETSVGKCQHEVWRSAVVHATDRLI